MTENAKEPQALEGPGSPGGKSGGGLGTVLWTLIAAGVVAGAAYASKPYWMPKAAPYLQSLGLAPSLESKNKAPDPLVKKALTGLESGQGRLDQDVKALAERMDALDKVLEKTKAEIAALAASSPAASSATSSTTAQTENKDIEGLRESLGETGGVLAGLQQRIARLEQDAISLEKAPPPAPVPAAPPSSGGGALNAALEDVSRRVGLLEQAERVSEAAATGAPALVLAVGQLRDAVARSGPFVRELESLKALAGTKPGMLDPIAVLQAHAGKGVATLVSLRDRFGPLAGRVVGASRALKGKGWMERTANRLSSLVSVRKTGSRAAGDGNEGTDGVVARAESLLAAQDLAGAVRVMESLTGAPAEAAASWIGDAKARLAVERAANILHAKAVSLLAPVKE